MHVDDWIDEVEAEQPKNVLYAKWFFSLFRMPSLTKMLLRQFIAPYKLFCTYDGKRYRVTGCSRLGDVWLHSDFDQDTRYEHRVDLEACSDWSNAPDASGVVSSNEEFALACLKNMGHDVTCGACMSIAFTGSAPGYEHTCCISSDVKESTPKPVRCLSCQSGDLCKCETKRLSPPLFETARNALERASHLCGSASTRRVAYDALRELNRYKRCVELAAMNDEAFEKSVTMVLGPETAKICDVVVIRRMR